ncbi:unnamed protein product [[Candida] boidinii]|uniref:Unnamed protein product n=1 Tax=Candida boidinii TaxID=5477 RepID=A0A9W6T2N9_CANBO|nr:unnamed protein product [[Candida] boidinii]
MNPDFLSKIAALQSFRQNIFPASDSNGVNPTDSHLSPPLHNMITDKADNNNINNNNNNNSVLSLSSALKNYELEEQRVRHSLAADNFKFNLSIKDGNYEEKRVSMQILDDDFSINTQAHISLQVLNDTIEELEMNESQLSNSVHSSMADLTNDTSRCN